MRDVITRLLAWLGVRRGDRPGPPADPYAWKPAPLAPRRPPRSGRVAVAEPEDESSSAGTRDRY